MAIIDLFQWWAATISAGSLFLTLVGVYLYLESKKKRKEVERKGKRSIRRLLTDFIFVWVLLGLLIFYIVSIDIGSDWVFAAGNVLVEAALVVYVVKNKTKET
jgi:O-antigen/teichoic acid export membrane protein